MSMSSIRLKKAASDRSVSNCQTALKFPKNLKANSSLPANGFKLAGEIRGSFFVVKGDYL
ncbi:hypothetical protein HO757_09085 [Streptococcus suis]|nr:hypothetical protein [Streptococcus suis]NQP74126.1 hypothetical protein [Streptococcus suis]NQP76138.1 hypothetical protein [Streptococcus suis]NQP91041.1 hypothetical protein [Streptococcus suis]NQP92441.1 hypothetical protein [Streptococcus suis]